MRKKQTRKRTKRTKSRKTKKSGTSPVSDTSALLLHYLRSAHLEGMSFRRIQSKLVKEGWDSQIVEQCWVSIEANIDQHIAYAIQGCQKGIARHHLQKRLQGIGLSEKEASHIISKASRAFVQEYKHLKAYILYARKQELTDNQIVRRLHQIGWEKQSIKKVLNQLK